MKQSNQHPPVKGERVTDCEQSVNKREMILLLQQKMESLQKEEAHLDAKEAERLLQQQSYQLDDFLDPEEIGMEEIDFDPLINESTRTAQIAHSLAVLGELEEAVRSL
ncbi:MAG: hypothetical protein ACRBFS_21675 [Aureispira sp.]